MSFDKLQQQWNQDVNDQIALPKIQNLFREARLPVDKVRKNIKNDLIFQLVGIVLIGLIPLLFPKWDMKNTIVFSTFFSVMLGFIVYYGIKFYTFYKKSYNLTYDSRKNLLWFSYELRLYIELYRALTFILIFLGMGLGLYFGLTTESPYLPRINIKTESQYMHMLYTLGMLVIPFGIAILILEYYINFLYGKYYKQINIILDQLDEE